jgi:hypothetical protein
MTRSVIFVGLISTFLPSVADALQVTCENPRREYLVRYEEGDRYIRVGAEGDESNYTVLAVEKSTDRFIIAAQTPNGGPTVRFGIRPYLRMEYWVDGQLFQTDACRNR